MERTNVKTLARRFWKIAGMPQAAGRPELLEDMFEATFPFAVNQPGGRVVLVNKLRLAQTEQVDYALPLALANEAIERGVSLPDVLRSWADALDPRP
jgi:hypothetical protein